MGQIKTLTKRERPREKLQDKVAQALSFAKSRQKHNLKSSMLI